MIAITPPDVVHLLHEALSQLGWSHDPQRLAERLAQLHRGLPREDEFAVVCTWLGRCKLVHKLDQMQSPCASDARYQVPDLLAIFEVEGRDVPVLIEVKASEDQTLSFRPDYRARLLEYAKTLGLPLLVAWKHHSMWTLFDIHHMKVAKKNYNISVTTALPESLLGILAGDFSYTLPRGTGIHLRMMKDKLLSSTDSAGGKIEEWQVVFDDIYHTDGRGRERRDLAADVQALFLINTLEQSQEHTDTHVYLRLTVGDDENKFAHMALSGLLEWYSGPHAVPNWREVIRRDAPVPGVSSFAATVEKALDQGIVQYIFHLTPRTRPAFLGPRDEEDMGLPTASCVVALNDASQRTGDT